MLTRLKVSGFKNLVDVDVRFGPFTCVVGPNGVGKSNLFDVIRFLSALANQTLMSAAASVRDQDSRTADVRSLFHRAGDRYADKMSFEAEMLVPRAAVDDLGQVAKASITFLRYSLELAYRETGGSLTPGALKIVKEELVHISQRDALKHLLFPHSVKHWRESVVHGRRTNAPFISTQVEGGNGIIYLHQDGGGGGPLSRPAANLPRTVLSVANAAESPTVLVARREMESWRMLQLEPAALRRPDEFAASTRLGTDGSHLAATLYRLARNTGEREGDGLVEDAKLPHTYSQVADRLIGLMDDAREIYIDRDEKRELLTLYAKDDGGTPHPAWALSDGTLRFLALAVLEMDPETQGVLCLEEPENGIHPARIPAILELLCDIAADTRGPIGSDNPLRQVIVNTHSPAVFQQVPDDNVLFVKAVEAMDGVGHFFKKAQFCCLPDTWRIRASEGSNVVVRGDLLAYLNPVLPKDRLAETDVKRRQRVVDREDTQQLLLSVWC